VELVLTALCPSGKLTNVVFCALWTLTWFQKLAVEVPIFGF